MGLPVLKFGKFWQLDSHYCNYAQHLLPRQDGGTKSIGGCKQPDGSLVIKIELFIKHREDTSLARQGHSTVAALVLPLAAGAHPVRAPPVRVEVGPDGEGLQAHLALERGHYLR